MNTVQIFHPSELSIAAQALKKGELVAFPTETVYGLGGNVFIPEAIQKIFRVKQRPLDNPLIVHLAHISWVEELASSIPDEFYLLAKNFFPGPLTILLKRHPRVPAMVSAGLPTIALRMPSHPYALHLIAQAEVPVAAPSANLSGKPSPTTLEDVLEDLEGKIPYVVDGGRCDFGIESTVLSLIGKKPQILRPGVIQKETLEEVIKKPISLATTKKILAPGMKYIHYSPRACIRLFSDLEELQQYVNSSQKKKILLSCKPALFADQLPSFELSAKNLYFYYRQADRWECEEILIFFDESIKKEIGLWNRIVTSCAEK